MTQSAKIYDCRVGANFSFNNAACGLKFSSVESGFIVIEGVANPSWRACIGELTQAIQATSESAFMTVAPWWPGGKGVLDTVQREFGPGIPGLQSVAVVFEPTLPNMERAIRLREDSPPDGEWGIGGAFKPLQINVPLCGGNRSVYAWDLTAILCQAGAVGCYLHSGELQSMTFLTRPFEGVDRILKRSRSSDK